MGTINLSKDELEELETIKELCEDMYIDGNKIICFDFLSDLVNNKKSIEEITSDELLIISEQLKGYKQFWSEVEWFNNDLFESILPKISSVIREELNLRKR